MSRHVINMCETLNRWNETVDLDVSDCTDLCITSSSEVITTSQLMIGVANKYFY